MSDRTEWLSSLTDLDGVRVAVAEPLSAGLTSASLRGLVEGRLRSAGVPLLGMGDFPTGDPHLRVALTSVTAGGLAACHVQLDFVQIVFMRRNPAITFNRAQTWKADAEIVLASPIVLAGRILDELGRQVDQFITDYRTANP